MAGNSEHTFLQLIPAQRTEIFFNLPVQLHLGRKLSQVCIVQLSSITAIDDVVCLETGLDQDEMKLLRGLTKYVFHFCLAELVYYLKVGSKAGFWHRELLDLQTPTMYCGQQGCCAEEEGSDAWTAPPHYHCKHRLD